uniref:Uncharacterized protein n=1 Tax=Hyaloperonospora arabidopsidis (strain Emoy2) TaxID=559515 RepID=M4BNL7_HYAAE
MAAVSQRRVYKFGASKRCDSATNSMRHQCEPRDLGTLWRLGQVYQHAGELNINLQKMKKGFIWPSVFVGHGERPTRERLWVVSNSPEVKAY